MSDHDSQFNRRGFLEATGFALFASALEGCGRAPVRNAMGPATQIAGSVAGKSNYYATVCGACSAACGCLVKNRDGRPIKLEGNPEHPLSQGGLCAMGQAAILSLYDSHRLKQPRRAGKETTWADVDHEIMQRLDAIRASGGAVRVLTGTIVSPTRRATIQKFLAAFKDGRHVTHDSLSSSAIPDAHQRTHGRRVLPHYRFDQADAILGLDADFLGTWIAPVQFTAQYQTQRVPSGNPPTLSFHAQLEGRLSLTGARADLRVPVPPDQIGLILEHLADWLARQAGVPTSVKPRADLPIDQATFEAITRRLWETRGKALVVCGAQETSVQVVCNLVNHLLDAYGHTIMLDSVSYQKQGDDSQLMQLCDEIESGKVAALLIADANPVYALPDGSQFARQLANVALTVSFSDQDDETAAACQFVCPEGHWLEQWSDAEPIDGTVSISQPAILPLGATRPLIASLSTWMKKPVTDHAAVLAFWKDSVYPRAAARGPFQRFWEESLRDGFAVVEPAGSGQLEWTPPQVTADRAPESGPASTTLVLYPKIGIQDGRHANNPWLQELPDPISKTTWDNYVCVAPRRAAQLGVDAGDIVRLETPGSEPIELPVLVQPGQHERVLAVALGYGRKGTDRFAHVGPQWIDARPSTGTNELVGVRVSPLLRLTGGQLRYEREQVTIMPTGRRVRLARTQQYQRLDVPSKLELPGGKQRHNVEYTTLAAYRKNTAAGHHEHESNETLWPDDHRYTGHHWGLIIDLNKCTGCSACAISCQAENNVPVVGRDEVRRNREMHWIRIDRYYVGDGADVGVLYQPMMCHQCDNAPCETVCPVIATAHSKEGLNQQIYNRCVGTRYCANNCPYKVRRFNWFNYAHPDKEQNLVLNPDVTVRTRGVMEKCSFCVQRIQQAKLRAKRDGVPLADGDIQTACQQSCPANAIVFGDLNDPKSALVKAKRSPRLFQVLAELNVRPTVGYLRVVRNREGGEEPTHHV